MTDYLTKELSLIIILQRISGIGKQKNPVVSLPYVPMITSNMMKMMMNIGSLLYHTEVFWNRETRRKQAIR